MPTFTRKYLKDKDGNHIAPASLADMIQHTDGETTEVKMQTIENKMGTGVLNTVAQDVVGAINELKPIADEVIAARTDAATTYVSLDSRLDSMDAAIAAASGADMTLYATKQYVNEEDTKITNQIGDLTTLTTTEKTTLVGAINEIAQNGGNVDLTDYQTIEDADLETTSKEVVGAINEIHTEMLTVEDFVGDSATTDDVVAKVAVLEVNTNALMEEIELARTDTSSTVHNTLGQRLDSIEENYLSLTGGQMTGNIKLTNNNALITGLTTTGTEVAVAQVADNDTVYIGDTSIPTFIKGSQTTILQPTDVHGELRAIEDDIHSYFPSFQMGTMLGAATDGANPYTYLAPIVNGVKEWDMGMRFYPVMTNIHNTTQSSQEVYTFGGSVCPINGITWTRNLGSEEIPYARWSNIFLTGCTVAGNGVIKLPNKTLMQWGTIDLTITTGTATKQLVTLPTSFPNGCLYAQSNVDYNVTSSPNEGGRYWDVAYLTTNVSIESASTIMVHLADPGSRIPGGDRTYRITWMAFGY